MSTHESVPDLIDRAHRAVWHGVGLPPHRVAGHPGAVMDGHETEDAYDAEVATLSEHLGAVEAVVHPVARRRLTDGRKTVRAQRARARSLERQMRLIEGRLHGDTYARGMDVEALQRDLEREIAAYARAELDLARRLDAALTPAQRSRLVTRFGTAMRHAPTRPHPYAPHPRGLAGPVMRICSAWDHALDLMDNRKVPGRPPRKRSKQLSLWDRYFLGTAGFDWQAQPPAPATEAGPASAAGPVGP